MRRTPAYQLFYLVSSERLSELEITTASKIFLGQARSKSCQTKGVLGLKKWWVGLEFKL
jgi:hypothetical protein